MGTAQIRNTERAKIWNNSLTLYVGMKKKATACLPIIAKLPIIAHKQCKSDRSFSLRNQPQHQH